MIPFITHLRQMSNYAAISFTKTEVDSNSEQCTNLSKTFADDKETKQVSINSATAHSITIQHLMSLACTTQ